MFECFRLFEKLYVNMIESALRPFSIVSKFSNRHSCLKHVGAMTKVLHRLSTYLTRPSFFIQAWVDTYKLQSWFKLAAAVLLAIVVEAAMLF